jgi:hypothetical protein
MNGASGFHEVRSSTSRLQSYRFLHEQRHQLGKGFWHLLHTHNLTPLSTGISTKQAKVPGTIFLQNSFTMRGLLVFIVGLLLIGASAGCSFFTPPASEEELNSNQSYWFHYEAARRGGFLIGTDSNGKSKVKMCAEPAPDVALARTAEFIAKGTYQGATAEA